MIQRWSDVSGRLLTGEYADPCPWAIRPTPSLILPKKFSGGFLVQEIVRATSRGELV